MNEWLKIYDTSTWKIVDLKTNSIVSVYLPNVELANYKYLKKEFPSLVNTKNKKFYKITNGFLLFEFAYEPLLDIKDFNTIVNNPEEYPLLEPLYGSFLNIYFQLYKECIKWYKENSIVKGVFDIEEQIELYQNVIIDDYSCPILKQLDITRIQNINFKKAFVQLLKKSLSEKITSLNLLLYSTEKFVIREMKYTAESEEVIKIIINIVYRRFNNFLNEELKLNPNKKTAKKPIRKTSSLSCFLNHQQLKSLHKSLIEFDFIKDMKIENFVNCLSGKKVDPSLRIQWKKSKRKACYLFSLISIKVTASKLNASVRKSNYTFRSNDYKENAYYQDLTEILNKIDPKNKNFATIIIK